MVNKHSKALESFFQEHMQIIYKRGDTILRPEDTPQGVYFIQKGFVRSYSISEDGKDVTLNIFRPGSYFPMSWALGEAQNNFFYEALTACNIYRAPKQAVIKFLQTYPEVLLELTSRVLVGLDGVLTRMHYILSGDAQQRVVSTIVLLAKRFGQKKGKNIQVSLPVTHKTIASLAGLTRETTSVIMKKITKDGYITSKNRKMVVKKIDRLEEDSAYGFRS